MDEYKCTDCKKITEHYLKRNKCDWCGGDLKYIYKPYKCSNMYINISEGLNSLTTAEEFVPVRSFLGDIWYYRKKRKKSSKK